MPVCVHVCAYDDFRKLTDSLSQLFIVGNENKRLSVLHFLNHSNTVLSLHLGPNILTELWGEKSITLNDNSFNIRMNLFL